MTQKQDRIRRLIDEADGLPDDQINAWKERARLAVAGAYGVESTTQRYLQFKPRQDAARRISDAFRADSAAVALRG